MCVGVFLNGAVPTNDKDEIPRDTLYVHEKCTHYSYATSCELAGTLSTRKSITKAKQWTFLIGKIQMSK
jgi:hypothetical protein